ncbi:hypothetical protein KKD19_03480 [Patescibacteria group bacterium]|nr:hypothetical protein [Patescibacteria group bacterium]MCG2693277.1 hypothetical protein [Candidatus Parcubacteria bacterium]
MIIPAFRRFISFPFLALSGIAFLASGVALIILTVKEKIKGGRKKFLILTGASAVGFFPAVFLHNAFYALGMAAENILTVGHLTEAFYLELFITILKYLAEALHIAFFCVAVFICPLGLLVGTIGSAVLFIKNLKRI